MVVPTATGTLTVTAPHGGMAYLPGSSGRGRGGLDIHGLGQAGIGQRQRGVGRAVLQRGRGPVGPGLGVVGPERVVAAVFEGGKWASLNCVNLVSRSCFARKGHTSRPCSHSARVLGSMQPPGVGHQYFSPNNPFLSHHLPPPACGLKPLPVLTLKAEG